MDKLLKTKVRFLIYALKRQRFMSFIVLFLLLPNFVSAVNAELDDNNILLKENKVIGIGA